MLTWEEWCVLELKLNHWRSGRVVWSSWKKKLSTLLLCDLLTHPEDQAEDKRPPGGSRSSISGWAAWDEPASLRAATSTVCLQPEEERRRRRRRQSWRQPTFWTPPPGKGWWRCCAGQRWWSTGCLWCGRRRGPTGVLDTAEGNTAPPPWWCWFPRYSGICAERPDLFRRRDRSHESTRRNMNLFWFDLKFESRVNDSTCWVNSQYVLV